MYIFGYNDEKCIFKIEFLNGFWAKNTKNIVVFIDKSVLL